MAETNLTEANTNLWSTYLAAEWERWLRASHPASTVFVERTAALVAAIWAPWLMMVTRPVQEDAQ